MRRALAHARRAEGRTRPNPPVGAVLSQGEEIVGEGHTAPAGGPHAEIVALRQAGSNARGATLHTTLEPCCHVGRTPPCADAIVAAGIARVVVAVRDPNPRVDGGGVERLRAAGVTVELGDGEGEARALYAPFAHWIRTRRPFVTVKYAMTLDGRIATSSGHSRWITGPEARRLVHEWRDGTDAILIGAGTALADDPLLTTRLGPKAGASELDEEPHAIRGAIDAPGFDSRSAHHPLRILLDSQGRVPLDARLFDPALPGRTLVASTDALSDARAEALAERDVELLRLPADADGRVLLPALLDELGEREITTMLVEGGAAVLGAFFAGGHVHRLRAFIAPKIVGGAAAPGPVGDPGIRHMDEALSLSEADIRHIGTDWLISAELVDTWAATNSRMHPSISEPQEWKPACSPALSKS